MLHCLGFLLLLLLFHPPISNLTFACKRLMAGLLKNTFCVYTVAVYTTHKIQQPKTPHHTCRISLFHGWLTNLLSAEDRTNSQLTGLYQQPTYRIIPNSQLTGLYQSTYRILPVNLQDCTNSQFHTENTNFPLICI